jgi:cytidyltransferase-like protein
MKVITLGTFDTLHLGHIQLIQFCQKLGDVVVGLNTDEFVEQYKHKRPVMSYEERKAVLEALGAKVIPNDQKENGIIPLLEEEKPELIVIGSDWARKDYVGQIGITWDQLDDMGIGICYFPRHLKMSTTIIKERIKNSV